MRNFKLVKHGFCQAEVEDYISKLKNDYESRLSEQKNRIFYLKDQLDKIVNSSDNELVYSLVSAVERAKVIENSSINIYELETKKIGLLYSKMEKLLRDDQFRNEKSSREELLRLIQVCRNSLQQNILAQRENIKESEASDPMKRLLSKMIDANKLPDYSDESRPQLRVERNEEKISQKELDEFSENLSQTQTFENSDEYLPSQSPESHFQQSENAVRKTEKPSRQEGKLKPDFIDVDQFLSKEKPSNGRNFESIMFTQKDNSASQMPSKDKNKKSESDLSNPPSKSDLAPNESGFDLKEAVNPKEELDEIMKAFDFYNDSKK